MRRSGVPVLDTDKRWGLVDKRDFMARVANGRILGAICFSMACFSALLWAVNDGVANHGGYARGKAVCYEKRCARETRNADFNAGRSFVSTGEYRVCIVGVE